MSGGKLFLRQDGQLQKFGKYALAAAIFFSLAVPFSLLPDWLRLSFSQ
jgi:hypothetical protein